MQAWKAAKCLGELPNERRSQSTCEYSVSEAGLDGGFYKSDLVVSTERGSALIVLYSKTLEETLLKVEQAGGAILKPIFSFPGGRRFHFTDPNGNEYAVWSDVAA
jgi:predicted enzyme related to lactoylglutathione lyase